MNCYNFILMLYNFIFTYSILLLCILIYPSSIFFTIQYIQYIYIYIYIYIYVHMYILYIYIYTHIYMNTYLCIYLLTSISIYLSIYLLNLYITNWRYDYVYNGKWLFSSSQFKELLYHSLLKASARNNQIVLTEEQNQPDSWITCRKL